MRTVSASGCAATSTGRCHETATGAHPLPVWVCDGDDSHTHWIGSLAELADAAGGLPDDFDPHRPFIDELTWACADCDGTMRRTPEVIDVWFDSGAMPFAQWHYPFENQDEFRRHFPADFISEGLDQTRGWFYSLMAISTLARSRPVLSQRDRERHDPGRRRAENVQVQGATS